MFCPGKGLYSQQHRFPFLRNLAWVNSMWHHHPPPQQTNSCPVLNPCHFLLIISSFLSFNWLSVLAAVPCNLIHNFSFQHEHHKMELFFLSQKCLSRGLALQNHYSSWKFDFVSFPFWENIFPIRCKKAEMQKNLENSQEWRQHRNQQPIC